LAGEGMPALSPAPTRLVPAPLGWRETAIRASVVAIWAEWPSLPGLRGGPERGRATGWMGVGVTWREGDARLSVSRQLVWSSGLGWREGDARLSVSRQGSTPSPG
jgi:hypothetical protein